MDQAVLYNNQGNYVSTTFNTRDTSKHLIPKNSLRIDFAKISNIMP